MKKHLAGLLCLILISSICIGCNGKKNKTVTLQNADIITYEYIGELAKEKLSTDMVYLSKLSDYVKVEGYDEIAIDVIRDSVQVDDGEVDTLLEAEIFKYATVENITTGKVAKEDTVNLTILTYIDDAEVEDSALRDYVYKIGGNLMADLDGRLPGLAVGETYKMPAHFNEDYADKNLAGKDVVFTITINSVVKYTMPERDEALFTRIASDRGENGSYANVDEFKSFLKEKLYNERLAEYDSRMTEIIWEKVMDKCELIYVPQWEYARAAAYVTERFDKEYEKHNNGESYDEFWANNGYDAEGLKEFIHKSATEYAKEKLCTMYIAKNMQIAVTTSEFDELVKKYGNQEDLVKRYGEKWNEFVLERYYELIYSKVREQVYKLYWRDGVEN